MNIHIQESINKEQPIDNEVQEMQKIAVLDFQDPQFPQKIVETFKEIGFAIITNHGISPETIEQSFAISKSFFQLPSQQKTALVYDDSRSLGYKGVGGEILDPNNPQVEKK